MKPKKENGILGDPDLAIVVNNNEILCQYKQFVKIEQYFVSSGTATVEQMLFQHVIFLLTKFEVYFGLLYLSSATTALLWKYFHKMCNENLRENIS